MDHLTTAQKSRAIWMMIGTVLLVAVGLILSGTLIALNPQNLLWASLIVVSLPGMAFTIYASALKDADRSLQTLTLIVLTVALVISALSVTSAAIPEKDFVPTAVITIVALLVSAGIAFFDRNEKVDKSDAAPATVVPDEEDSPTDAPGVPLAADSATTSSVDPVEPRP